ncbi:T9SS type A sorting domain-containing protein [Flavobacterium gelidilacus]|uniref:DUF7619 domain-containing protein n=1 Tax=Flavobacterium gelidilacus TaxID=206041 RepID=UPI00047A6423|nr:T9SS type A sorting domain-containing protein [Flavobacterium gelidilacus]
MKKLYFLVVFVVSFAAQAQIVNIPDANFKAALLSASYMVNPPIASSQIPNSNFQVSSYNPIDINNNGEIEQSEALLIKYLNVSGYNITDLTGIEYFVNLIVLSCSYNQLTSLDVSQNINLIKLQCTNSPLSTLNISQNLALSTLWIRYNQLTSLDVSQNINLEVLLCTNNLLTSLDVSQNPNLIQLQLFFNQISNLDVSQNPNLEGLLIYNNSLSTLDLSQNSFLNYLNCNYNQINTLYIKNNNAYWQYLSFYSNPNLQYICADDEDINLIQQSIISYGYNNCHVNTYCSFNPNGTFYTIEGNSKLDFDNNGCDLNDIIYPNLNLSITDGTNFGTIFSNMSGNYSIPIEDGNHTITPNLENPTYFNISPASFVANFPTQTSPSIQGFCVTANGVHHDVEVTFIPTNPARPGFDANYTIIYKNKGTEVENGTIALDFNDAVLDLVSANPTTNNQQPSTLTWNYTNLQPFETRTIDVVFNVNSPTETPAVNNGDILSYSASITPLTTDEFVSDNVSNIRQIVVGSYDPNDKTCIEGTTVGPDMIGQYVHYVIRFENTGTYAAENVVVKDMIDLTKFDVATLIPLHSSHDFVTRINADKVEFIFEGINLPFDDATNDGYVAFKIKTKSNLVVGNTFSNNANIYFDYNFPITTNTFTTTIAALKVTDFDFGTHFTLYPNPVKDVLNIQSKDRTPINSIEIYNTLGQIVLAVPNTISTVDVSTLQSGNYFIKVNTDLGVSNTKFIKE